MAEAQIIPEIVNSDVANNLDIDVETLEENFTEEVEGITEDQLKQLLSNEIADAMTYIQGSEFIADDRETNYEYYRGLMDDLPAPQGRSKVTDRAVSTYINMMLPSLLRVFTAGKNLAVYETVGE